MLTLLPSVWNEKFVFPCQSVEESIEIVMEDVDMLANDFMGKLTLPMEPFQDKKPSRKWHRLKNSKGVSDAEKRGDLELLIHWKFNPSISRKSSSGRKQSILGKIMGGQISDEEATESEDEIDPDEKPKTEEEIEAERLEKEENEKKLKEELGDIEIKSGDYQVQVHVIEVRDLKAEDDNGLSDPVVYVEAFGKKFNTKVIHKTLSAVFDERFIINLRDLDKEVFDAGQIKCTVMDADFGSRNGEFSGRKLHYH